MSCYVLFSKVHKKGKDVVSTTFSSIIIKEIAYVSRELVE
jgi:hypothetical protein